MNYADLLRANPSTLVAAMSADGRLTRVPSSIDVQGRPTFFAETAMRVFVPEDRPRVLEAWVLAQEQPWVSLDVRVIVGPRPESTVHFFDLREQHGVHLVVLETPDPETVLAAAEDLDSTPRVVAHVRRDGASTFLEVDDATTVLLGWSRDELIGRRTVELIHPEDRDRAIESWLALRNAGPEDVRANVRLRHKDGRYVWVEGTSNNHLDDPDVGCVLSRMVDVSEHMASVEALRAREQLLTRLAETLPIGVCYLGADGKVVHSNPPLVALLGPVDSVDAIVAAVVPVDRQVVRLAIEQALRGRPMDLEVGILDGAEERRCELTLRTMAEDGAAVDGIVLCASDVTDRSRLRVELEHRASHDALTGCLNRAAAVTALEHALRTHPRVVVAYIDLDRFKAVNDRLGHAAGDELLRVVAARLRHVIRPQDRLGRIGGDEFVVISPQLGTVFDGGELVERLRTAVNGDVTFARQRIPLQASVGAAVSGEGETDAESLLVRADAEMYEDKRVSRSRADLRQVR